jgi:hypothetical protein
MAPLVALSPREASIFACLADAVVAPEPILPPVRETDAVAFFDRWMARSPRLNRAGLRALLYTLETAPRFLGFGARMRQLSPPRRAEFLRAIERNRIAQLRQVAKMMQGLGQLAYYGDDRVMLILGYDADANVARGRALRARDGRP